MTEREIYEKIVEQDGQCYPIRCGDCPYGSDANYCYAGDGNKEIRLKESIRRLKEMDREKNRTESELDYELSTSKDMLYLKKIERDKQTEEINTLNLKIKELEKEKLPKTFEWKGKKYKLVLTSKEKTMCDVTKERRGGVCSEENCPLWSQCNEGDEWYVWQEVMNEQPSVEDMAIRLAEKYANKNYPIMAEYSESVKSKSIQENYVAYSAFIAGRKSADIPPEE